MTLNCRELRLKEMLGDSIIKTVMEADGVDSHELETELRRTAALLHATRRARARPDLRGKGGIT